MQADISNEEQLNPGLNEMKSFIYQNNSQQARGGGEMIASQGEEKKKKKGKRVN